MSDATNNARYRRGRYASTVLAVVSHQDDSLVSHHGSAVYLINGLDRCISSRLGENGEILNYDLYSDFGQALGENPTAKDTDYLIT